METNPVITIHSATSDWSNLGATREAFVDKQTIQVPVQLGEMKIDHFLEMDVEEITEDTICFRAAGYKHELRKGQQVCVTYTVGGYTDHDGCDWDGTDYDYFISWKNT